MLQMPDLSLDDYTISLRTGFLPESLPMQKLPDPYYSPWENIASVLPATIQAGLVRHAIDKLPVLSTTKLQEEAEWRRAYVVLAFLTHAYIWGGEKPKDIIPPTISRPFLEVSAHLELPPCATYAALVLWNFVAASTDADLTVPENLSFITSFTGSKDEEWFYMISVTIEAKGAKLLQLMFNVIDAVNANDAQQVAQLLDAFTAALHGTGRILDRMNEKCTPTVFFHHLRPFLAGSKNMAAAGLPNGVFYDFGEGRGEWHQYSGGSNAQSSLIQAFDIFLGVEHTATGEMKFSNAHLTSTKSPYINNMRFYMPGPHRRFLELLTKMSNVRSYALSHKAESDVRHAYNAAIMSLGSFRDVHLRIVSRYIIIQARRPPPQLPLSSRMNLATATSQMKDLSESNASGFYGTGGTNLIPFLKQTRDATKATAKYSD